MTKIPELKDVSFQQNHHLDQKLIVNYSYGYTRTLCVIHIFGYQKIQTNQILINFIKNMHASNTYKVHYAMEYNTSTC